MKICYLVNTTSRLKDTSTTLDLALESIIRGHDVNFLDLKRLRVENKQFVGVSKSIQKITQNKEKPQTRQELAELLRNSRHDTDIPLDELDCIFIRSKPTVNSQKFYDTAMKFLSILNRKKNIYILNNPNALPNSASKIILRNKQLISNNVKELYDFCENQLKENAVAKLFSDQSSGGRDVYFLDKTNKQEWKEILGDLRKEGYVLIQPYINNSGDVRVLLLEGDPIGCYRRFNPAEGKVKHNMVQGATAQPYQLTAEDFKVVKKYRRHLITQGLDFVGLDLLDHKETELNCNNPGGTVRIHETTGEQARTKVIEYIERRIE
jgi:glutathione synthase